MRQDARSIGMVAAILWGLTGAAEAQVIGTFRWQTQPYCNAVTMTVVQYGALFQLIGSDNLCGAGPAPLVGTAVPAGSGVILGFTAALPSGRAAHLSATISLSTLSGTWSDADGTTGAFVFNGAAAGSPRPLPSPSTAITVNQFAATVYGGTGSAATLARSDHSHDDRYYTRAEVDRRVGGQLVCGSVDFFPSGSADGWTGTAGRTRVAAGTGPLHCGLQLPVGATITGLTAVVVDNDPVSAGGCSLGRLVLDSGTTTVLFSTAATSGASATPQTVTGTAPPGTIVDGVSAYRVFCPVNADIAVRGAIATYAFD